MYTVNNYLRNIKVYFTWLYDSEVIKKNPTVQIRPYKHRRKPKSQIKDVDFNKLIKSLDLTSFAEYRDYVILQLLMDTGMRIGETLNLKMDDVLIDKKAIFIPAEIAKGRKNRYVFFSTIMQGILRKWIDYKERYFDTEYVFISTRGSNFNVMNFEKNLKKYCIRARIAESITCHQIRNNFARRFLLSGGEIFILSKILGHSSVIVTEQAYLDVTSEDIRKSYQRFSPLENMRK
ncbi:tyrosine-type recombinase/integrase [Clostridium sp. IBUN125C]|uniref:tyrosine-type recombinase/integrase n=1 Tax=unclassified Clostridium TaxID=2614128 RepID=UPI000A84F283